MWIKEVSNINFVAIETASHVIRQLLIANLPYRFDKKLQRLAIVALHSLKSTIRLK